MKILVVEDRVQHADLVCKPLSDLADTILVDSVDEAKKVLNQNLQIACIILDLQIYKQSKQNRHAEDSNVDTKHGIELLKHLVEEIKYPPDQIFITTVHNREKENVNEYLSTEQIIIKPFSSARFVARIEDLLKKVRENYKQ
jgi:CheY-like chemotaxis protein